MFGVVRVRREEHPLRVHSATPIATVLACLALAPQYGAEAAAQVIRGVVVDSASQQPLPAVLVSLADSDNRNLQRFLTDEDGEFSFLALRPGRYSVRVERLGMRTEMVDGVDVAAGQAVSLRITLAHLPITLRGIEASGDRRCELPRDLGLETLRVWEEARKVLATADFTSSAGVYVYDLGRYVGSGRGAGAGVWTGRMGSVYGSRGGPCPPAGVQAGGVGDRGRGEMGGVANDGRRTMARNGQERCH